MTCNTLTMDKDLRNMKEKSQWHINIASFFLFYKRMLLDKGWMELTQVWMFKSVDEYGETFMLQEQSDKFPAGSECVKLTF
jgi:hypothetical protein